MTKNRVVALSLLIAVAAGFLPSVASAAPLQTCTAQTLQGFPISGNVCGGTTYGFQCSAGVIYRCQSGPRFQQNNCTLSQVCSVGCFTRPSSATSTSDVCFSGAPPLTLSTNSTLGGTDLGLTVTLVAGHPSGAFTNMKIDRGDLVPGSYCGVPNLLASQTSVSFALPTAVVSSPTKVNLFVDLAYTDTSGVNRQLVPVPSVLTLNPGGTEPPAPEILNVTLSPSTIAPGGVSIMDVELAKMAPARGIPIAVSSSNPSAASVIANGQPLVLGGCIYGGGAETIQAAKSVPSATTVTISASSGAPGQAPVTTPLTVTAGCSPKTCLEVRGGTEHGGPCGSIPDGCGGNLQCGCDFGETCGGGGVAGQCGTAPSVGVSGLSLNPSSVTGGSSSTGTVTLNMAAPSGGVGVFLSSSAAAATVPGSVVVPQGQTSASFTVSTAAVSATNFVTISATSNGSASAVLTVNPASSCTPTTCAAQGKNCGTISNGCGGTLTCGSCTAPQTCGGGGVANLCGGGCTPTTCAAQGKNCGTIADGCGGTLTCGSCTAPQTCGGGGVANVCGGTTSTAQLTVTASGRSGESVSSSPAGLKVNVGTSSSASFATGTVVTLSVSNDRDAIWSGGCSSGSSKTKSCSLTLNAAASVTANVQ